jgi:prepilin signal peptidase PulO-like enzyme (type II secretory pathway)
MSRRRCPRCHRQISGYNAMTAWSRGQNYPRCRACVNHYQARLMRERRRKGLSP